MEYLRKKKRMSDSVLRYMEKKRKPFGKEVDYKLLFVYERQFGGIKKKYSSDSSNWRF